MFDMTARNGGALTFADPAAVAAAETAKARIQSAYVMAFQKPRSEDQARAKILEACRRPDFAERVEYAKPVGNRKVRGPSIRFAELAVREWGNVLTESSVLYEDDSIRRIRITCIDLETNATFSKEVQITKTVERRNSTDREVVGERKNTGGQTVYIVKATDEELINKEASLISKAIRNEGLRLIPSDIIDEALVVARDTLHNRAAQDPKAFKKQVLDSFSALGIKPKNLEQYLDHGLDTASPAELQDLRSIYTSIRDGEANWNDYLKVGNDPPPAPQGPDIGVFVAKSGRPTLAMMNFLSQTADTHGMTTEALIAEASKSDDRLAEFLAAFDKWAAKQEADAPEPQKSEDKPAQKPKASKKKEAEPPAQDLTLASAKDENDLREMLERKEIGKLYKMEIDTIMTALKAMDGGDLTAGTCKKIITGLIKQPADCSVITKALDTKAAK